MRQQIQLRITRIIIVTLEDSSTLRLYIETVANTDNGVIEGSYELILKRDANVIASGAWEVVSGSGEAVSGDEFATLTYETSDLDQIGVTLRKNNSDEFYSVHVYGGSYVSVEDKSFIVTFKTEGKISGFDIPEHPQFRVSSFNKLEAASNNSYEYTNAEEIDGRSAKIKDSVILDDANTFAFSSR